MGRTAITAMGVLATAYVNQRFLRGELTAGTAKGHRYALLSFADAFGDRSPDSMGPSHVQAWLAEEVAAGRAASTRQIKLSVLRGFTRWLATPKKYGGGGVLRYDPCIGVRSIRVARGEPKIVEVDETVDIVEYGCPDARARLIVLLMAQDLVRCVSVHLLDLDDIGRTHMRVIGKGGHVYTVPVIDEVRDAIEDYIDEERGSRPGPLIQNRRKPGQRVSAKHISQLVAKWSTEAGVKKRPFDGRGAHGLRRGGATHMLDNDVPIDVVAEGLGHVGLSQAKRYAKTRSRALEKGMKGRSYRAGPRNLREVVA